MNSPVWVVITLLFFGSPLACTGMITSRSDAGEPSQDGDDGTDCEDDNKSEDGNDAGEIENSDEGSFGGKVSSS